MTTAAPARPPRSTSISTRLTLVILPLVIVPLLAMGVAAYLRSQQLLRTAATAQLSSAVAAEAKVLLDWSRARQDRISLTAQSAALRQAVGTLLGEPTSIAGRVAARAQLDAALRSGNETLFTEAMVVRASDSRVMRATEAAVSVIAPSLIFEELEIQRIRDILQKPPVVPSPLKSPGL